MSSRDPQVAGTQPDLPGDADDATIKLVGDVFNAVLDVKERVRETYLVSPGQANADVVSLAVTILQRAIGKDIVLVDPVTKRTDKALTAAVLWNPQSGA
jgi:hypothetical protein